MLSPVWQWDVYYKAVPNDKPKDTLLKALSLFEEGNIPIKNKVAIDLGCGNGPDTLELLKRNWNVTAIDSQKEALEVLSKTILPEWSEKLQLRQGSFEGLKLHKAHFINASLSLPFCRPEYFKDLWNEIVESLDNGGRFAGNLFGINDSWAVFDNMTFHTRTELDKLFVNLDIEHYMEHEQDGYEAGGTPKHWHIYHIVARKR